MTYDKLNDYILNYIEKDKTGRAIMLTGDWGSGKSYYLKNTLKPFLESKDNGKHKCVFVSLYGLSDVSEISKAIYMELRTIKTVDSEGGNTAKVVTKIIGKTVFNGIISKIGFDIGDISEDDLRKVYESVDLTDKLIILEDIERTQINILNLLGYINNMCENDMVKVLLVANENELLKYSFAERKITEYGKEKSIYEKVYSEESKKYLSSKEKTISDTLVFYGDTKTIVDSIIDLFNNDDLDKCKGSIKSTNRSYNNKGRTNYREVIVACQKSCYIFDYMSENNILSDDEFKKCVFIGLVNYLQKRLDNHDLQFKSNTIFSTELSGNENYPLIHFCYDYYNFQTIDKAEITKAITEYKDYMIYVDKPYNDDPDLSVIYKYYFNSEKEVDSAIANIYERLANVSDISLVHYDRIINILLIYKYDYLSKNEKIDLVIERLLDNLKGRGNKFSNKDKLFSYIYELESEEGQKKFEEIKKRVTNSLNYRPSVYEDNDFTNYNDIIPKINGEDVFNNDPNLLLEKMQLDRLITQICGLESKTLDNISYIIQNIGYRTLNENGISLLVNFKQGINNILEQRNTGLGQEYADLDIIKKKHLKRICRSIDLCLQIQQ